MAPKKAKLNQVVESSRRVTRSSTAAASSSVASSLASLPHKEPPKKKPRKSSKKEEEEKVKPEEDDEVMLDEEVAEVYDNFGKTVIIEHCKQCKCFKVRADQVKNGLENGVTGVNVLVNPEKPRRGCFEIREEGGEAFITLLDLKRPFTKLKDLDMDEVISDIVNKIK